MLESYWYLIESERRWGYFDYLLENSVNGDELLENC